MKISMPYSDTIQIESNIFSILAKIKNMFRWHNEKNIPTLTLCPEELEDITNEIWLKHPIQNNESILLRLMGDSVKEHKL